MTCTRGPAEADGGSGTVWALGIGLLIILLGMIAALRGSAVLARHRAETAADFAALAAAIRSVPGDGCIVAASMAAANGGRLVLCSTAGPDARVRVAVHFAPAGLRSLERMAYADARAGPAP